MRLGYVIFYVENVKETLAFYEAVFGLKVKFLHESGDFGELETGTTSLAFSSVQLMQTLGKNPSQPIPTAPSHEIAFVTDDVAATLDKAIALGGTLVQLPEKMSWGQTTAYFTDQNGFLVEICTEI